MPIAKCPAEWRDRLEAWKEVLFAQEPPFRAVCINPVPRDVRNQYIRGVLKGPLQGRVARGAHPRGRSREL